MKVLPHLKVCHPEKVTWEGINFLIHLLRRPCWSPEQLMLETKRDPVSKMPFNSSFLLCISKL